MNKNPPDELSEVRSVVPPSIFLDFLKVFARQELLELTSNNSVLYFVHVSVFMRSALNTPDAEKADGPSFHSLMSC